MSEFIESETSKEEAVEATTIEVASEPPTVEAVASEAMAEGSTETVMEAASVESTAPSSTNIMVESVKAGAGAAQEAVADFLPVVGKTLRKLVYNGFYYVSFGVTFSALTVASLVPTDNVMGQALADGAEAAKEVFRKQRQTAAREAEPTSGEGLVAA
ncbi:MAG TPA: hypothetical protein VLU73_12135 [Methylococcaceae bacterium]|nr:hypothetical protein [Methylococcaceae bacterium]